MAKSEISDKSFKAALVCFSTWYDDRSLIRKLKVLYQGYIAEADIHNATKTMDLLNQLTDSGHLRPKDLTLLYDTIKATKQFGVLEKLQNHIPVPSFSNVKDMVISKFSHHQQQVLNFGNALIYEDVLKIDNMYNDPPKNHKNGWDLILHLQHKNIICEEKEKMDEFIETLKSLKIPLAVKALTKEAQVKLVLKRKRKKSNPKDQLPPKKALDECLLSSERSPDENQPPCQSTNPVDIIDHLDKHKGNLKFGDSSQFTDKLQDLVNYYSRLGVKLTLITEGSIVFHLSVIDKFALINLLKMHQSGTLLKDLAEIVVAEENQQKLFQDEWITRINQLDYHNALCKLKEKGDLREYVKMKLVTVSLKMETDKPAEAMERSMQIASEGIDSQHLTRPQLPSRPTMPGEAYIEEICTTLRSCNYIKPLYGSVLADIDIIMSLEVDDQSDLLNRWIDSESERRPAEDIGRMIAHCVLVSGNESNFLSQVVELCTNDVVKSLSNELNKFNLKYTIQSFTHLFDESITALFLINLLSNSPRLHKLCIRFGLASDTLISTVDTLSLENVVLELGDLDIGENNLGTIKGTTLSMLLSISPKLRTLNISSCSLSGAIADCMISDCVSRKLVLALEHLEIRNNNFCNIKGTSLAMLLIISPKLRFISISNCSLSSTIVDCMVSECVRRQLVLKLDHLNVGDNNLSDISGTSIAMLLSIAPKLKVLNISFCSLSGDIVDSMASECVSRKLVLELDRLDISHNNLGDIKGTSLAMLLSICPKLRSFSISDCSLSGVILDCVISECVSKELVLELDNINLRGNNVNDIKDNALDTLRSISPKLRTIYLRY